MTILAYYFSHIWFIQLRKDYRYKKEEIVGNEAIEIIAWGHVVLRQLSTVSGISHTRIRRIFKPHKFHPNKINFLYKLNEDDW